MDRAAVPRLSSKRHMAAERIRHDQNIGKQNRGIEAEAVYRLQRHFRRQLRIETQIEEAFVFSRIARYSGR